MRRLLIGLLFGLLFLAATVGAQTRTFTKEGIEYTLDLPSSSWQPVARIDVHDHLDFINGTDIANGYLRLRKILVDPGTTAADIFQRDEKWDLQRLPGYVVCSECKGETFEGQFTGTAFSYEYVSGGKAMAGRVYYLQLDKRIFYSLRFTVARDRLQSIRDQMDVIARSFRLK